MAELTQSLTSESEQSCELTNAQETDQGASASLAVVTESSASMASRPASKAWIVAIVIAVVILALLGAAGYYFYTKKGKGIGQHNHNRIN